jgi:hypothetical protein
MSYIAPSLSDFKERFDRDFAFAANQTDMTRVRDKDITIAVTQAAANFNVGLFANQDTYAEAFQLLTAHYLCINMLAASQGLGGSMQWLTSSKAVGNVSESYAVPEWVLRSRLLGIYAKTSYGMAYLSIVGPLLVGNVSCIAGDTTP